MDGGPEVPFSIMSYESGGVPVVRAQGEMDYSNASGFEREILKATSAGDGSPRRVVVDLSGLSFLDSEGLKVIFDVTRRLKEREVEARFVVGSEAVERLFEIAEVRGRLPLYPDVRSAVE